MRMRFLILISALALWTATGAAQAEEVRALSAKPDDASFATISRVAAVPMTADEMEATAGQGPDYALILAIVTTVIEPAPPVLGDSLSDTLSDAFDCVSNPENC